MPVMPSEKVVLENRSDEGNTSLAFTENKRTDIIYY